MNALATITRPMQQSAYQEMSLKELYTRLASHVQAGETALIEGSKVLAELKRRGENHPLMSRGLFKWFEQVNAGTLDASAVIKFAGDDQILSRLVRLPISQQVKIATTGTVRFVEERKGEIIETEKPIISMRLDQLNQAFHDGKIRTVAQQTKIIKAAPPKQHVKTTPLVYANKKDGTLTIAGRTIEPSALVNSLRELGFKLERVK